MWLVGAIRCKHLDALCALHITPFPSVPSMPPLCLMCLSTPPPCHLHILHTPSMTLCALCIPLHPLLLCALCTPSMPSALPLYPPCPLCALPLQCNSQSQGLTASWPYPHWQLCALPKTIHVAVNGGTAMKPWILGFVKRAVIGWASPPQPITVLECRLLINIKPWFFPHPPLKKVSTQPVYMK